MPHRTPLYRPHAQVDTKFIALACGGGLLAIIDQHAADERVRLEALQAGVEAEYACGGATNMPPVGSTTELLACGRLALPQVRAGAVGRQALRR